MSPSSHVGVMSGAHTFPPPPLLVGDPLLTGETDSFKDPPQKWPPLYTQCTEHPVLSFNSWKLFVECFFNGISCCSCVVDNAKVWSAKNTLSGGQTHGYAADLEWRMGSKEDKPRRPREAQRLLPLVQRVTEG